MMVPSASSTSRTQPRRDGPDTGASGWAVIDEVDAAVRSVLATQGRIARHERRGDGAEVFASRLFALRHAEALPDSAREVRVAPGTVVTPLARDLLRKRGIALRLVSKAEAARVKHPGEWGFAIENRTGSGLTDALRRALLAEDWRELDGAARWVAEDPVRGALVLSDEASLAVWRACQVAGVRAANVADPDAVARAVRSLGVNLIVVEPSGKSISWLRQLGLTFRRAGAPEAPEGIESGEGLR